MAKENIEEMAADTQAAPVPEGANLIDVVLSVPMEQLEMTQTVLQSLNESVAQAMADASEQTEVTEQDETDKQADILAAEIEGMANNRI